MDMGYYILNGKRIKKVSFLAWGKWFGEGDNRRVAETRLEDGTWISTVFLGIDHNFGDGPPLLFETMVFGKEDGYESDVARYSTTEAERGHKKMVKKWKNS